MNNSKKVYDWCIVGGGITGLVCAELLSRDNKSVILVEKNKKLAGETSADFHEWFHLGSLYSINKNNNNTIKILLDSFKKMNQFYSEYENFNIKFKHTGFEIKSTAKKNWFNNDKLELRYLLEENKLNIRWLKMVTRSIMIIKKIKNINWKYYKDIKLYSYNFLSILSSIKIFFELLTNKKSYYSINSEDFSFNSRIMIQDLLSNAIANNLKLSLNNKFIKMNYQKNEESIYEINCSILLLLL